jgi:serine/threonine-protein kinase
MSPVSYKKFTQMPMDKRIEVYEDILDFHSHVVAKGYVAIDFYGGSILYDFEHEQTTICDIDFYSKTPYTNEMGRLWGSSRFMSPEEFTIGAVIDEVTNVYVMGATAFALFADSDRTLEKWPLSKRMHGVVKRAVSDERNNRQQSIQQLIEEWRAAK